MMIGLTVMQSMLHMSNHQSHLFLFVTHTLTETQNVKEYASETPPRDEKCKLKYHDIKLSLLVMNERLGSMRM